MKPLLCLLLVALLSLQLATALPYEMAWLRIKSDPKLESFFEWTEFGARKSDTMDSAIRQKFNSLPRTLSSSLAGEPKELHLYKLIPIDMNKTIEELQLDPNGQDLYLTGEDLMAR